MINHGILAGIALVCAIMLIMLDYKTHTLLLTTPELGSNVLDHSAMPRVYAGHLIKVDRSMLKKGFWKCCFSYQLLFLLSSWLGLCWRFYLQADLLVHLTQEATFSKL